MLPVTQADAQGLNRLCPGARRSFFCRMKYKSNGQPPNKEENTDTSGASAHSSTQDRSQHMRYAEKKYCVIQCTGYLKSWASTKASLGNEETADGEADSSNMSCLVAIGRIPPNIFGPNGAASMPNFPNLKPIQFNSRHGLDGKFIFVDQRLKLVLVRIFVKFQWKAECVFLLQSYLGARLFAARTSRYQHVRILSTGLCDEYGRSSQICVEHKRKDYNANLSVSNKECRFHTIAKRMESIQKSVDKGCGIYGGQEYRYIVSEARKYLDKKRVRI